MELGVIAYKPFRNLRIAGQFLGLIHLTLFVSLLNAQVTQDESNPQSPEEIYVTAKLPGPALWQVTNGENILYIFGALQPLPKDFDWDSSRVDWVISQSQEFIEMPGVSTGSINPLKILKFNRLKKLAGDQELGNLISASLYEKYTAAKELYAPRNRSIDGQRPLFVAESLFRHALWAHSLTNQIDIHQELLKIAQKHRISTTETKVSVPMSTAFEVLEQIPMETEVSCLEKTLESIEENLQLNVERAQAWANGHVARLKQFEFLGANAACFRAALTDGEIYNESEQKTKEQWITAASNALETNESSVTVLMIHELLEPDGYLSELLNLGYTVVEPN